MAATSPNNIRRKYSWWWDSHICPKNSKWLQENLSGELFQSIFLGIFLNVDVFKFLESSSLYSVHLELINSESRMERAKGLKSNSPIIAMVV
jgi:hypothetical protein